MASLSSSPPPLEKAPVDKRQCGPYSPLENVMKRKYFF
jgi:hypothetical protein